MPTLIFGYDLLFWIAVILTVVFFVDLSTCWWYNHLNWGPFRKWRDKMVKYHYLTRIILIFLIVIHLFFHILFQVFGIPL